MEKNVKILLKKFLLLMCLRLKKKIKLNLQRKTKKKPKIQIFLNARSLRIALSS